MSFIFIYFHLVKLVASSLGDCLISESSQRSTINFKAVSIYWEDSIWGSVSLLSLNYKGYKIFSDGHQIFVYCIFLFSLKYLSQRWINVVPFYILITILVLRWNIGCLMVLWIIAENCMMLTFLIFWFLTGWHFYSSSFCNISTNVEEKLRIDSQWERRILKRSTKYSLFYELKHFLRH